MPKLDFALQFEKVQEKNDGYPVVIVAAGTSSRMQGADKQFASLSGIPVLARTLRAFENCPAVSEITVVTREEKIPDIKNLAGRYAVNKLKNIVVGGNCREESVKNGVVLYKDKAEKVLVHDGARPLVSQTVINEVVKALKDYDSVTCGVKVKDTVKRVDPQGMSSGTVDRSELISVQTPQGVNVAVFLKVLENEEPSHFTDDTSVMEFAGLSTKIVEGDYKNIKITTPEDLAVAEAFIGKEW